MTPVFRESSFTFIEGEQIPQHIDDWPDCHTHDPSKWHLGGLDTFSYEDYTIAINIDSKEAAEMLYKARMRRLEIDQPSSSSGGQSGIQDRAYIVNPVSEG